MEKDNINENNKLQPLNNFVIFKTENGKVNIDVYFQNETIWLTQKRIAELFEKGRSTITEYLKKVFEDGELSENSVCRDFRHTAQDGKTAAEIIYTQADANKIYMGLKTWKQAPKGKILKDVSVAKNYLNTEHLELLQQIVTSYLDLAESKATNRTIMNMKNWDKFLIQFLELADYPILKDKGKISMLKAKLKAETEYEKFRVIQDKNYISDFDLEIKKITDKKKN